MQIEGFCIYGHQILPSGTRIVTGTIGRHAGKREHYEEARKWPARPSWASSDEDADNFAVFYHCAFEMRKKYRYAVLLIARFPKSPDIPSLPELVDLNPDLLRRYTSTYIQTEFNPTRDGDFSRRRGVQIHLIDAGTEDFSDFGGIVSELSRIHGVILLSRQRGDLRRTKDLIESTREPEELRERLLTIFDVFFAPNDEDDFTVATKDSEVVEALLRNPSFTR